MEELIEVYLRYLTAERNLSPYTLRNYRSDLTDFARYLEAEEDVGPLQVDRQAFRRYLARLRETGTAAASLGRKVSTIHTFYRFLAHQGILERDPLLGPAAVRGDRDIVAARRKPHLKALFDQTESFVIVPGYGLDDFGVERYCLHEPDAPSGRARRPIPTW